VLLVVGAVRQLLSFGIPTREAMKVGVCKRYYPGMGMAACDMGCFGLGVYQRTPMGDEWVKLKISRKEKGEQCLP
jgi:hypothetical protein